MRKAHPGTRLVLCGTGPAEKRLRELLPDAVFMGWTPKDRLAQCYGAADALVLPSRFDTFGCVVLEAMACGLPVLAYACKGPRDLVEPGLSGHLGETPQELAAYAVRMFDDPAHLAALKAGALRRAGDFKAQEILDALLTVVETDGCRTGSKAAGSTGSASLWSELLGTATE